jgi:hypothetical protein
VQRGAAASLSGAYSVEDAGAAEDYDADGVQHADETSALLGAAAQNAKRSLWPQLWRGAASAGTAQAAGRGQAPEAQSEATADPSHALREADVERFDILEAMLDREALDKALPRAPDRLAAAMLDDSAIAGMHAAAIDLSAAVRRPGGVSPRSHTREMAFARPDAGSADADDMGDEPEPHLRPQDFERGLADSYDAYHRACEMDRREMERTSSSGQERQSSTGGQSAQGAPERPDVASPAWLPPLPLPLRVSTGAQQQPGSAPPGGARDGSGAQRERAWFADAPVASGPGASEQQVREMYPAGRILHLLPAEMLPEGAWERARGAGGASVPQAPDAWGHRDPLRAGLEVGAAVVQGMAAEIDESTAPIDAGRPPRDQAAGHDIDTEAGMPVSGVAAPPSKYVLVDWVPQEAYGRIALCQTMLADHFLRKYIAAMDSLLGGFERG